MEMLTFFILVNFLWAFCPCREICSVLWWLWECILLEHPFPPGIGAFPAPGFSCNHWKSRNAKPQAQSVVSCPSPNPLELIIAKDVFQREIINLWETDFCLSGPENLTSGANAVTVLPHSFRCQLLSQNFWDVEHSYLGSQNTLEWSHSSECSRCSWEFQRSHFIDSKYSAKT